MALVNVPDPRLHTWTTWADAVVNNNPRAARVMETQVGEDDQPEGWRFVADWLSMIEPNTPRHDTFADWREWAINLMAVNRG